MNCTAGLRRPVIPPHLPPVRVFLLCQSQQDPVTHPRSEHTPVWFARRIICFLLGDLVSLFFVEVKLKKNLGRKLIQMESDLEGGSATVQKVSLPTTSYLHLQKLRVTITAGHYHLLLPTV